MSCNYFQENKKHIKISGEQICAGHEEGQIDGCKVKMILYLYSQGAVLWFKADILSRKPRFDTHMGKPQKKDRQCAFDEQGVK